MDGISALRLVAALVFASIALQNLPLTVVLTVYVVAMSSDLIDGYLARRLCAQTYFGKVLDLVSDKSLTITSLLYAAARGIDLFPLALIAIREIIMIGARLITVEGTFLLPTSRVFGGIMALLLWGDTLFLVVVGKDLFPVANVTYWVCSAILGVNLVARLYVGFQRLKV